MYWTDFADISVALFRSCSWKFKGAVQRNWYPCKTDKLQQGYSIISRKGL